MSDDTRRCRIVHVDLSVPLMTVPREPDLVGMQLVFWLGGLPLGRCEVTPDALPLLPAAIATLASRAVAAAVGDRLFAGSFAAPLPVLPAEPGPAGDAAPFLACEHPLDALRAARDDAPPTADVSVIVCTRDRPDPLARCLASLRASRTRPREILVVDNAPTTGATRDHVATLPDVRYLHEPRPGLSIARNAGVRATDGAIVAFTDDDVVVHPDWIGQLAAPFRDARVMAVTGLVLPGELESEAQRHAEERLWNFNREFRRRTFDARYFARLRARGVPVWHVGAGANMAFRREAFARVGLFDERLGAGAAGCSEDSELWYRVLAGGWSCAYEPAAVVFHYHRADLDALTSQWHAYMRGHVAALLVQLTRHGHWGNLRRILLQLPLYYALGLRDVARDGRDEGRLWWAAVTGAVAGVGYFLRHRGTPPVT